MEPVIKKLLEINKDQNRKKIIQFISDKLYLKYRLFDALPKDLIANYLLMELKPYIEYIGKEPDLHSFPNQHMSKDYAIELITEWIKADLDKIYYYDGDSVVILDKMDILTRNSKKMIGGDRKLISKLLDEGMIILKVLRNHYMTFHKDLKTGNIIDTSTLVDSLLI